MKDLNFIYPFFLSRKFEGKTQIFLATKQKLSIGKKKKPGKGVNFSFMVGELAVELVRVFRKVSETSLRHWRHSDKIYLLAPTQSEPHGLKRRCTPRGWAWEEAVCPAWWRLKRMRREMRFKVEEAQRDTDFACITVYSPMRTVSIKIK